MLSGKLQKKDKLQLVGGASRKRTILHRQIPENSLVPGQIGRIYQDRPDDQIVDE